MKALVANAARELGGLDGLVNNAGIYGPKGLIEEVDWAEWVRAIEINLLGTVLPVPRGPAPLPEPRLRQDRQSVRRRRDRPAAAAQRLRGVQGGRRPLHRDAGRGAARDRDRHRTPSRPARSTRGCSTRSSPPGPDKVGKAFYDRALKQKADGGAPLDEGAALCVFLVSAASDGITGQAAERRLGPLGRPARRGAPNCGERHLHAAANRSRGPRPGLGGSMNAGHRRLRSDRRQAAAVARASARLVALRRSGRCARAQALAAQARGAAVRDRLARGRGTARRGRWSSCRPATTPWRRSRAAAVEAGKHVLVEKPAARTAEELVPLIAGRRAARRVRAGRLQPPLPPRVPARRASCRAGALGPLMFIRGRYGHGGRVGYDKEWRADPEIAGGGELLDQGVHLIDLSRWFLGDFTEVTGHVAHVLLGHAGRGQRLPPAPDRRRTGGLAARQLHRVEEPVLASRSIGRDGKLHIDGLGGSYGVERLSYYRMMPQMGPPETTIWEYPGEDTSWRDEFAGFRPGGGGPPRSTGDVARCPRGADVVHRVYAASRRPAATATESSSLRSRSRASPP